VRGRDTFWLVPSSRHRSYSTTTPCASGWNFVCPSLAPLYKVADFGERAMVGRHLTIALQKRQHGGLLNYVINIPGTLRIRTLHNLNVKVLGKSLQRELLFEHLPRGLSHFCHRLSVFKCVEQLLGER
jgi:hypothetical protein